MRIRIDYLKSAESIETKGFILLGIVTIDINSHSKVGAKNKIKKTKRSSWNTLGNTQRARLKIERIA